MAGNLSPRFVTASEDDLLAANEAAVPTSTKKSEWEDMNAQNCLIYLVKILIDKFCRNTSNQESARPREIAVPSS